VDKIFGTIILDAYRPDEIEIMAGHIDEICSPMDSVGWSSAGIYSFWDYNTKETLYLGLASDLCVRFKQHNGLMPINETACKYQQIQKYFTEHEKLGYTILVQSNLSQPIVQRNEKMYRAAFGIDKNIPIEDYAGEEGLEHIKRAEGQLIEAYRLAKGKLPPWNKVGGDKYARKFSTKGNYYQIIRSFSIVDANNFLVAKSTIRELAGSATYEWFEVQLHSLRMMMLTMGMSYQDALSSQLSFNPWFQTIHDRIENENYTKKQLVI
jgi:hypothetical protein